MKYRTKIFIFVISVSMTQGCSSIIPIKTQTSKIKKVANCIVDGDSHGQCTHNISFVNSHISPNNTSYFNILDVMELPEKVGDEKKLQSLGKINSVINSFDSYKNKYNNLDCVSSYNFDAATITKDSLSSISNKSIHNLFNEQLSGGNTTSSGAPTTEFDTQNFNTFMHDITEADSYGGLNSLQCAALRKMSFSESQEEVDALGALIEELSYTKAYFNAYFRHGKFIRGTIKVSALYDKLKVKLKNEAPFLSDKKVTELVKDLFKKFTGKEYDNACAIGNSCEIDFIKQLETAQFVTRAGVEYGFPHIIVSVDPLAEKKISVTKVDWNRIGAEVAKVYIEAVGDKLIGLPSDPRSTACKINNDLCFSETNGGITLDNFASVGEHSDKIDALVSNAVGKAIRGGGWVSLNNEAIASIIESAVGTVTKKVAEKVAYCTYSCIAATNAKAEQDAVIPSMILGEIKVKISR